MHSQSIRIFFIINVLFLAATACQGPEPASTRPSSEQTIIALIQTITAQASGVSNAAQPVGLPSTATAPPSDAVLTETPSAPTALPPATIEASATPYVPPTITVTSSPAVPLVSVSSETNCRTGPSANYKLIWKADAGTKFVVVGRHSPTDYWIIRLDDGRECWLSGQSATVEGNVSSLAEYNPPALGKIEGEVISLPVPNASKVAQASVNIGLGFAPYTTQNDGKFIFEDVPLGEVKIDVTHSYYRFQNSFRVIVNIGQLSTITIAAGVPIYLTVPAFSTPAPTPTQTCPILLPNCRILILPTFVAVP